jgi:hypothetical protein
MKGNSLLFDEFESCEIHMFFLLLMVEEALIQPKQQLKIYYHLKFPIPDNLFHD